ncbi:MAG: sugar ABC transporter permease [Actinobacteria bacterium]|nr:sugar ABC transporter permease [Actinomycetota bacterium]MBI3687590.1 sugar ABC transporter permease [Actinomycetota bacterium]
MTSITSPASRAVLHRPAGRGGRSWLRRSWDRHWYAWAMIAPVVLVLVVLVLYPLIEGIRLSLTDATVRNLGNPLFGQPDRSVGVGVRNYLDILTGSGTPFWTVLVRTMIWTGSCVLLHYTLGMGLAMMLNRPLRGRSVYRILLILPWAVPAFVSAFAWRFLFNGNDGMINRAMGLVGLDPIDWLGPSNWALVAVIAVNVWLGVPFMMVALLGGMQTIPPELYEAAEVDGASAWQQFTNVTLPGLRSVSATVILLGVIWTFNMFPVIFLLTRSNDYTQILVTFSYNLFYNGQIARAATYGVLILSLLLVFASAYRRMLRAQGEVW